MSQSCRTCKYLNVLPDKSGRIVPRKQNTYRCLAPDPVMPRLPDSITQRYGFKWFESQSDRTYMAPDDGQTCPCYEVRIQDGSADSRGQQPLATQSGV